MKPVLIYELNTSTHKPREFKNYLRSDVNFEYLVEKVNNVLFKTSSVFPFDFFPDEIAIDTYKVSIIMHKFFLSNEIHSISIDMIKDIEVETGPFLANLVIVPDGYPGKSIVVNNLKKRDAIKARKIIQGLMLLKRRDINISDLNKNDLFEVEQLGRTHLTVW